MNTKAIAAALVATTALVATSCGQSPEAQFLSRCTVAIKDAEGTSVRVERHALTNFGSRKAFAGVAPDPSHSQLIVDYTANGTPKRRICTPMWIDPTVAMEWPRDVPVIEPLADPVAQAELDIANDAMTLDVERVLR